jgi:hypothetical protein
MSSTDHDELEDSPPATWGKDKEEDAFIGFLGELDSVELNLPLSHSH